MPAQLQCDKHVEAKSPGWSRVGGAGVKCGWIEGEQEVAGEKEARQMAQPGKVTWRTEVRLRGVASKVALLLATTVERKVPWTSWLPEPLVQVPALPCARQLALGKLFSILDLGLSIFKWDMRGC